MRGFLEQPWLIVAVGGLVVLTVYVRQSTRAVTRRTPPRGVPLGRVVLHTTRPCRRCGGPVPVTETFRPGRAPVGGEPAGRPSRRVVGRCPRCEPRRRR